MVRSKKANFTNMCMVYEGDKILVTDRNDPDWPGLAFPGGHVEREESFADSVIREVYEKTGLTISAPRLFGLKHFSFEGKARYIVLLYKTDKYEGEMKTSNEGEVFWLEMPQLGRYALTPHVERVVEVMLRDDLGEFFTGRMAMAGYRN